MYLFLYLLFPAVVKYCFKCTKPMTAQGMKIPKAKEKAQCHICSKMISKPRLKNHIRKHEEPRKEKVTRGMAHPCTYTCTLCGKTLVSRHGLNMHMWVHAKTAGAEQPHPHVCHVCGETFVLRHKLRDHLEANHGPGPKMYECTKCSSKYHVKRRQKLCTRRCSGIFFTCHLCGKKFSKKFNLKNHLASSIHSGEKRYACNVCGDRFHLYSSFKRHQFRHSDRKPYNCEICGKGFIQKAEIVGHRKKYHQDDVRPDDLFQVNVCQFQDQNFLF